jgi:hypothetical protein
MLCSDVHILLHHPSAITASCSVVLKACLLPTASPIHAELTDNYLSP